MQYHFFFKNFTRNSFLLCENSTEHIKCPAPDGAAQLLGSQCYNVSLLNHSHFMYIKRTEGMLHYNSGFWTIDMARIRKGVDDGARNVPLFDRYTRRVVVITKSSFRFLSLILKELRGIYIFSYPDVFVKKVVAAAFFRAIELKRKRVKPRDVLYIMRRSGVGYLRYLE